MATARPNVVCFSSLMSCGHWTRALRLLADMQGMQLAANEISAALRALERAALRCGEAIQEPWELAKRPFCGRKGARRAASLLFLSLS